MARLLRTPKADAALEAIWEYIARDDASAADRVILKIDATSRQYANQPLMGEARRDLAPDVRCFHVGSYVVIYRPIHDGVELLTVVHGARDIPAVFRDYFP
jgi:toxin ParE1/3/4